MPREGKETFKLRRAIAAAGLVILGGGALAACSKADYDGSANTFTIRGVVSDSENDGLVQVEDEEIVVLSSNGKAKDWFTHKEGEEGFGLGTEYDFLNGFRQDGTGGFWDICGAKQTVGKVYDDNGREIGAQDLHPGEVVVIEGKIRSNSYWQSTGKSGYCADEDLAVYDTVRVVDEPLRQ
ncbi:MAG TPA: hypothetical protein VLF40_05940 [Candidatus Saccharimonadales bacterium]|nr:hypothetical protein [Candidatus Saccharimonadales bacterium]